MTQELTQEQKREKLRALLATSTESLLAVKDDLTEEGLTEIRTVIQEAIGDIKQQRGTN